MINRKKLRKALRQARKALTPIEQQSASIQLFQHLQQLPIIQSAQHFALYLSNDGEINPSLLIDWLWKQNKQCYLPVLNSKNDNTLLFFEYMPDTKMIKNKFGIQEPDASVNTVISAQQLDVVLMPLTAFTESGERLGMGGGYYDRTFSFTQKTESSTKHSIANKPVLIGLAHDIQKVSHIPTEQWDIPVSAVVTDQRVYGAI